MDPAKIALSKVEMDLVKDPAWILTKNSVMLKARQLLSELLSLQQDILVANNYNLPLEVVTRSAKISRGENYKGLPYLVLDHPRLFDKGHAFAIRTLFWWGHYFSVTLHLSGKFKAQYQNKIAGQYPQLKQHEIYINANDREWEHDLDGNDYLLIKNLEQGEWKSHVEAIPFIKLAKKFPLEMWDNAPGQLAGDFSLLLAMTGD